MKTTNNEATSLVPESVVKAATKEYSKNVPKKIKKLIKGYNKSKFYQPFRYAISIVCEGDRPEWADISEDDQAAIIEISRSIEAYA